MAKIVPFTFGNQTGIVPASELDDNFSATAGVSPVVVVSGSTYLMADSDLGVVNRKTVPGALLVTLPAAPSVGQVARISDFTGNIASFPLSVIAPSSGTINGATGALPYVASYETTGFMAITTTAWLMIP